MTDMEKAAEVDAAIGGATCFVCEEWRDRNRVFRVVGVTVAHLGGVGFRCLYSSECAAGGLSKA